MNYAVTTKLSNPVSIMPKCPKNTSAPVPKCRDTSDIPKFGWSAVSWVRSVLGPKCLYTLNIRRLILRYRSEVKVRRSRPTRLPFSIVF